MKVTAFRVTTDYIDRMKVISLDTAVAVTGISKRTWWRRISDGSVQKLAADAKGRALVSVADFQSSMARPILTDDLELVMKADSGDPAALNDLGQLLHSQGKIEAGFRFVTMSAEAGCADAMQWLGRAHAGGMGVEPNANLSLSWIARSAASGHSIATAQMQGLSWA